MKKDLTKLLPFILLIFLQKINAQEVLNFTALHAEGYGVYASTCGHQIPLNICPGVSHAFYHLKSVDNSPLPNKEAALHLVAGGSGFANFRAALTTHGFSLNQVEMSFTEMNLGNDQSPNDWFVSNGTESRLYRGGTLIFTLNGEDMVSGSMPTGRLFIDYKNLADCFDDLITGNTMPTDLADASGNSSPEVQAVASALLQDIGNRAIAIDFAGLQPAIQDICPNAVIFEAQSGTITMETTHDYKYQNTDTSPGSDDECMTVNIPGNSSGSGNWIHVEHDNELVCSILDSENMGAVNASIYINTANVRATSAGVEYLDRNFEITVANQPTNPVRLRIYFKSSEWEAFLNANDEDDNDIENMAEMKVTKFSGVSCSSAVNSSGGTLLDILDWGTSDNGLTYFIDVEVNGFSAFFMHGGVEAILPVELIYFSATAKNQGVMLEWASAYEENNERFDIERSQDGFHFQPIGQKAGAGNHDGWQQYRFNDQNVRPGETYYYRLRQLDYDGREDYSGVAVVKIPGGKGSTEIFPNPMSSQLFVEVPKDIMLPVTVELVSVFGHSVLRRTFDEIGRYELETSGLPGGIYEVVLSNERTKWKVGTVVK